MWRMRFLFLSLAFHYADLACFVVDGEFVFAALNERVGDKLAETGDGFAVDAQNHVALSETVAVMAATLPYQSYRGKVAGRNESDFHLTVAYLASFFDERLEE